MKLLQVASECYGLAKTGGLADMVSSLSTTIAQMRHDVRICLPAYQGTVEQLEEAIHKGSFTVFGHHFHIIEGCLPSANHSVILLSCPELYARGGDPYRDENGVEFPDNGWRFGCFSKAVAMLAAEGIDGWQPDLLHLHDWHSGLVPLFLSQQKINKKSPVKSLFTIHNFSFHGVFERQLFDDLGLPQRLWHREEIEFHGKFSFMKAALKYADAMTAVSPRYAREIASSAFGCGLEGVIQEKAEQLFGIVNGIDEEEWNPKTDQTISHGYDAKSVTSGKRANKTALQERLGLPVSDCPLVIFIGRLAEQKGSDLILAARPALARLPIQLVILGTGDKLLEQSFSTWAAETPEQVAVILKVNEEMAHLLTAAADVQLMPSRFEPCGLSQMYSQRYGTLPVAHKTGGLADTIADATPATLKSATATGFLFDTANVEDLMSGLTRALTMLTDDSSTARMRKTAMARDFSWKTSARRYLDLYHTLLLEDASDSQLKVLPGRR